MSKKSITIQDKLNTVLLPHLGTNDQPLCNSGFASIDDFCQYIAEGSLLNISKIASNALSIPSGDYMVWVTDVGHTMLIPVGETRADSDVLENTQPPYEVQTPQLLQNWERIQMVLAEDEDKPTDNNNGNEPPKADQFKADLSGIKRTAMFRAMQNHGYDQDYGALADQVGVQTPMISRILSGERTPSMGTASRLCSALSSDPTALFPDIFDTRGKKLKPKNVKGNSGSGMKGVPAGSMKKGRATKKWTQGNTKSSESIVVTDSIISELDSTLNAPMSDQANIDQVMQNQQERDRKQQQDKKDKELSPQIDQIESDIKELSDGLEQGQQDSVSSSKELENMQNQVNDIKTLIDKIAAGI